MLSVSQPWMSQPFVTALLAPHSRISPTFNNGREFFVCPALMQSCDGTSEHQSPNDLPCPLCTRSLLALDDSSQHRLRITTLACPGNCSAHEICWTTLAGPEYSDRDFINCLHCKFSIPNPGKKLLLENQQKNQNLCKQFIVSSQVGGITQDFIQLPNQPILSQIPDSQYRHEDEDSLNSLAIQEFRHTSCELPITIMKCHLFLA